MNTYAVSSYGICSNIHSLPMSNFIDSLHGVNLTGVDHIVGSKLLGYLKLTFYNVNGNDLGRPGLDRSLQ